MKFDIEDISIGDGCSTFIIAEMSGNHGGSLEQALEIVRAAKRCGADAVKLQTYRADTITLDSRKEDFLLPETSPWRDSKNLYALYEEAYTPWEWHEALFEEAKKVGILIFSSPFDLTAVDFLEDLGAPIYKIASPEITDIPLIKKVAKTGKPIILSTGVATKEDIELAIEAMKSVGGSQFAFLQCTTSYPAPLEDSNLNIIPKIKKDFNCLSGISDHTLGLTIPMTSVALGGDIIEKHFKLNDSEETVDSFFSLDENAFGEMVQAVRDVEKSLGVASYEIAPSAKKNLRGRRSLYVSKDIKKGERISEENIKSVRPSMGLHPRHFQEVLGMTVVKDLEAGERLSFDVLSKG